jgi:hypothetical protein
MKLLVKKKDSQNMVLPRVFLESVWVSKPLVRLTASNLDKV